jgi:hypothetical protein
MKATHNPTDTADTQPTPAEVQVTPADVLRGGAQYLQLHGWTQGDFFDILTGPAFPPACAAGAICTAATGAPTHPQQIHGPDGRLAMAAMHHFAECLGYPPIDRPDVAYPIGDWNDEDGRTLDEVTMALTEAADEWDRRHPAVTP